MMCVCDVNDVCLFVPQERIKEKRERRIREREEREKERKSGRYATYQIVTHFIHSVVKYHNV